MSRHRAPSAGAATFGRVSALLGLTVTAAAISVFLPVSPGNAASVTVAAAADAYVSSASPTTNFGTATSLKAGSSPTYRSYLTFGVSLPIVTQASLKLYPTASNSSGYSVSAVSVTSWGEKTITFNTAPAVATTKTASSGAIKSGKWVSLDVSSLVKTSGTYSFAITSVSTSSVVSLASRETTNKPQLLLTGVTTPSAPTGVSAVAGDAAATVSWQAPSSDGGSAITSYAVTGTPGGAVTTAAASARTVTVAGLTNGTAYTFTVAAVNAAGTGTPSASSNPVTPVSTLLAPVAAFTVTPTSGTAPLAVTVSDTSTGTVTSRTWGFGDGATATTASFTHSYTTAGTYTITLTVQNAAGSSQATHTVAVSSAPPPPPTASFTPDTLSGVAPLTVVFQDTSTGAIDTWRWDFGDGAIDAHENPTHIFTTAGSFTVTLVVTNAGGSDTASATIDVSNPPPPVADFSADPIAGIAPLDVTVTDTSTGVVSTRSWSFGDGGGATAKTTTHRYTAAGAYTITLTVTNAGGSDTASTTIDVSNPPPPVAGFSADPIAGAAPLDVTVTDTSTGVVSTRSWNFGDGGGATAKTTTHRYAAAGIYTITLTVTNAGGSDEATQTVTVTDAVATAPTAAFTVDVASGVAPLAVSFSDTSAGAIASWAWDFGDGGTDTQQNPSHTFVAPGVYSVVLTVTNTGGSSSATRLITVTSIPPPTAAFVIVPASGTAPLDVTAQDTSTGSPTAWTWDFGDNSVQVSGTPTATHTYLTPGSYVVTLTAANGSGATTATRSVTVTAPVVLTAPDPPTNVAAAPTGSTTAQVTFTPPGNDGGAAIDQYRVTAIPALASGWTGATSPITVTGLQLNSDYKFTVAAHNSVGWSVESTTSNFVPTGSTSGLRWAPPTSTSWVPLTVTNASPNPIQLTAGTDYAVTFGEVVNHRLRFSGGRNIKIIGGEVNVSADTGVDDQNAGLEFLNQSGTVFIEGVYLHGTYLQDGIRISGGSAATHVIQNCRIETTSVHWLGTDWYHTDGYQNWTGTVGIYMNRVTIINPYQGGMWGDGALSGAWRTFVQDHVNYRTPPVLMRWGANAPTVTGGQIQPMINVVVNTSKNVGPYTLQWVYYAPDPSRPFTLHGLSGAFWSNMPTDAGPGPDGQPSINRAHFNGTTPPMNDGAGAQGYVYEGVPPQGDYVAASDVGMAYASPGYR